MNTAAIGSKVWSFRTILSNDGVSHGDYLEQLTYLIVLKMADEYAKSPCNRDAGIAAVPNRRSSEPRRRPEIDTYPVTRLRRHRTKATA